MCFWMGSVTNSPHGAKRHHFLYLFTLMLTTSVLLAPNSELTHSPVSPWVETLKLLQLPGEKKKKLWKMSRRAQQKTNTFLKQETHEPIVS